MEITVEEAQGNGRPRGDTPTIAAPGRQARTPDPSADYLPELDAYYDQIKQYASMEPDQVLLSCSAISARLTEIRALCNRSTARGYDQLRIKEIDPMLAELERQAKIHSRLQSVRELDFKLSGGQV